MVIEMHLADLQLTHYLDRRIRRVAGISYSQFIVLKAIVELGHASQAEIANAIGFTPASVNPRITELEQRKLVHQEHSYSHQRSYVVYLTKSAERTMPLTSSLLEGAVAPLFNKPAINSASSHRRTAEGFAKLARRLRRDQVENAEQIHHKVVDIAEQAGDHWNNKW